MALLWPDFERKNLKIKKALFGFSKQTKALLYFFGNFNVFYFYFIFLKKERERRREKRK
jgi:hypothetical protein